jgi:hypothetical protein
MRPTVWQPCSKQSQPEVPPSVSSSVQRRLLKWSCRRLLWGTTSLFTRSARGKPGKHRRCGSPCTGRDSNRAQPECQVRSVTTWATSLGSMLCKVNGFSNPDSVTVCDGPLAGNSLWNATPGHLSRGMPPQKETVGKGGKVRLPSRSLSLQGRYSGLTLWPSGPHERWPRWLAT